MTWTAEHDTPPAATKPDPLTLRQVLVPHRHHIDNNVCLECGVVEPEPDSECAGRMNVMD